MIGDNAGDRAIEIHNGDQPIVTRVPEYDSGHDWAWRYAPERCDEACHHPVHAFGHEGRGVGHLAWFRPGTHALVPVTESTDRQVQL
ncbi:hypothetical protein [Microbacterium arborescens]